MQPRGCKASEGWVIIGKVGSERCRDCCAGEKEVERIGY